MDQKALRVRQRLRDDFAFYSRNALRIRTKEGKINPLVLNEGQEELNRRLQEQWESEGKIRAIILKGRQMGISTYIGGWAYWRTSQQKGHKTLVVTHHSDSTAALFDMTKRYHTNCPEALKPTTKYSSKRELYFDKLDSRYIVATAGADSVSRGETIQTAHLSEVAFWPKSTQKDIFNGIEQAIPNMNGSAMFVESTANGVSGVFYDLWQGAVKGENGFIPIFLPWYWMNEYREPVPDGFERSPDEEEIVAKYGLDDEQLMFRRRKIAQNGPDLFRQEYPLCADEAFLTSGRPVFHPDRVAEAMAAAPEPVAQKALTINRWDDDPRGELLIYEPHDPGETYYIGADVGAGVKQDWSVAQVLNSKKRLVATWRGQAIPDYFAEVLLHLGKFYNDAKLVVESNNHGILTLYRLQKEFFYPNLFWEEVYDKATDKYTDKLGFTTSVKSKPLVIDKLRAAVRDSEIKVLDKQTLREMQTYIVTESGKMEAEEGSHDDTVMALALAHHIHDGYHEPIAVMEEWYIEAI